ncbi:MAG: PAS-domain containing protein [Caulobacterales bacterium]|nr:PAS-domain containing protein [Caulobacterales bacterium]
MIFGSTDAACLIITGGAVAFAIAAGMWAISITESVRLVRDRTRTRLDEVEADAMRVKSILGAFPGTALVWEDEDVDVTSDWGTPLVYGSIAALAQLLKFTDDSAESVPAARILDGLADWEARGPSGETTTLRRRLERLRTEGTAFSLAISGPDGRVVEADGRAAGARVVVWLADATLKREEETAVHGRLEEARQLIAQDPGAFLDLIEKAPVPIWRQSSGRKLQYGNAAFLAAVETPSLRDAIEADVCLDDGVKEQTRNALTRGARVDDTRGVVVAGARRQLAISVFPVAGGAGGLAIDITRERQANDLLKLHVRAQDEALNPLDEAVAILGSKQELVFHNHRFAELFGFEEGQLAGEPDLGSILDELRKRRLLPAQSNYAVWKAEELQRYADKSAELPEEVWVLPDERELHVTRLRHPLGGMLMIFADRTEQMTLTRQFKALLKVQSATLDKLNEGVAVFGSDGRLRLSNAAFARIWNLTPEQVAEKTPFDTIVEACLPLYHDREAWTALKGRITDTNPVVRKHTVGEFRRADEKVIAFFSRPLPDGATIIAFNDETAERELKEALRQRAEALEAVDRVKSDFVGHVSYQLRAPLQTVLGYAELLLASSAGLLPDKQGSQLSAIIEAATSLNKMVDDIIDVAAIDAETMELDLVETPLREALESAVVLADARAVETEVRVTIEAERDLGVLIADARRLKQIVYDLLHNALRHTPAGGHIVVGALREGDGASVWVEDNGPGIDYEQQATVFDPFQAGTGGGAGLGLTLVRELVELHGGWVELTSEPGVGTRVTCHFPGRPPVIPAKRAAALERSGPANDGLPPPSADQRRASGV